MHPQIQEDTDGECPICGMDLEPKTVAAPAPPAPPPTVAPGAELWTCPMHPQILQEEFGTCPICKMDLVPMKADGGGGATVSIDPVVVQNMGVRLGAAKQAKIARSIRTVGTVLVPEDRVSVVNLRYSGWIERLIFRESGVKVAQGDPLFEIYSPELVAAQQEYRVAVRTGGPKSPLAEAARQRLRLYGLPRSIARRLDGGKAPLTRITVRAPASGFVVHKDVVEGARVMAGKDVFRIAELSTVWVEAEVYEHDAPWVEVGAPAQIELSFQSSEALDAKVDYIYPTLNERTRTLRVRFALSNPDLRLKPGAFATVAILAREREVLTVPSEAILRSGTRQVVFVAQAEYGKYAPREITTGLIGDQGRTEVLTGLHPGEQLVVSGQFLIDSESQLQEAVQKMLRDRLQSEQGHAH